MVFFINWVLSAGVWFGVAYLFSFSIWGWIIGLLVSFLYKEFVGPIIIIAIGDKAISVDNNKKIINTDAFYSIDSTIAKLSDDQIITGNYNKAIKTD